MNILITGGAGFIGSNLVKFHLNKNDTVTVIDNLLTGNLRNIRPFEGSPKFIFFQADIVNYQFDKLQSFDIVYHLASPASPKKYKKYPIETLMVNSLGTKNVLDFCINSKSQTFILASTSEVYGDPLIHPQVESYYGNVNTVGARSCYDEAKRFAETLVMTYFKKYNFNIRIARIFNTYGPNMEKDDGRVVSNFIVQALANTPLTIYGNGRQTRSLCYIDDMVDALYRLAITKNINGEIINLGNTNEITVSELGALIKKLTNSNSNFIYEETDCDDPKKRKPDTTKAKKLLDWEPKIDLQTGLDLTINYFKQ